VRGQLIATSLKEQIMSRLNGKTAVVTGGGTGIGLGAAKRFVEEGAFVYIFGRRQEALDAALTDLGPNARAVQGSVTNLDDLDRLYGTVKDERGGVDVLFANAGTGAFAPLGEITPEHYDQIFDINVKGVLFTVQKALPLMGRGSSIILTGSSTSVMGTPQFSVYSATKAAIRNLARSWALDLQGTGIRVNVLSPGPTKTDLALDVVGEEAFEALGAATPIGRLADPSETGAVAAFLASADSSYMTGGEIFVDGGLAQV
jgi:NAD(P)-dependent dehydrogenase (short-subunit alcohol dehydrogenase family)